MSRPILFGLVALALLCFFCIQCHAPAIESDIRDRAQNILTTNGLDAGQMTVSGRDLTLVGTVGSDEQRRQALNALRGVEGVRVVHDDTTIARAVDSGSGTTGATSVADTSATAADEPGSANAAPLPLTFATSPDGIVLRGTVQSDAMRTQLVATARAAWGDDRVTDRLTVANPSDASDPGATSDNAANRDRPSFANLLGALHAREPGLETTFETGTDPSRLVVSGEVLSELARERTLGALGSALPGVEIVDQLTVRPPTSDTETLQARLDAQMVGKIVEFETSSDRLTPRGQAVLDELATLFATSPGRVEISGHTDSRGNPEFNRDLSRRRASSARRYLVSKGLDNDRFTTVGHGASRPIADNETAEGRQRNRRTEFRALEDE